MKPTQSVAFCSICKCIFREIVNKSNKSKQVFGVCIEFESVKDDMIPTSSPPQHTALVSRNFPHPRIRTRRRRPDHLGVSVVSGGGGGLFLVGGVCVVARRAEVRGRVQGAAHPPHRQSPRPRQRTPKGVQFLRYSYSMGTIHKNVDDWRTSSKMKGSASRESRKLY